jgi:hypothetical protein
VIRWTTPLSRKKFHIPQRASRGRRSTEGDRVYPSPQRERNRSHTPHNTWPQDLHSTLWILKLKSNFLSKAERLPKGYCFLDRFHCSPVCPAGNSDVSSEMGGRVIRQKYCRRFERSFCLNPRGQKTQKTETVGHTKSELRKEQSSVTVVRKSNLTNSTNRRIFFKFKGTKGRSPRNVCEFLQRHTVLYPRQEPFSLSPPQNLNSETDCYIWRQWFWKYALFHAPKGMRFPI